MLNAGFGIRMGWKAVELIFSEATRKKISLTSKAVDPEMLEMIDLDQLEEKFGGTALNVEKNFWSMNP